MSRVTNTLGFRLIAASYVVVAVFMSIVGILAYWMSKDSIKMGAMTMVNRMSEELALAPGAPPEELGDRLLRLKVLKSGSTWIMDKDGYLLYNPDPLFREEYIVKRKNFGNVQVLLQAASPRASGQGSFKEKLVDIARKYDEGFGSYRQFGEERILAFRKLPGRDLLIGVDEPVSSANSELERLKKIIFSTALVSAVLIMAFSLLAIKIIIRPYYHELEDLNASLQHSNRQLEEINGKLVVSNRNLTILYEVGLGMRHSLALRDVLDLIVGSAHQALGVDRIAVFLPSADGRRLELSAISGETQHPGGTALPLSGAGGGLAAAFQRKEQVRIEAGQRVPPSLRLEPPAAEDRVLRTRAYVAVPLVVKDRAVGVIAVDNKGSRKPIGDDQVNLLGIFANQAAVAIDNARLYEQLRHKIAELDAKVDQLSILHQIGNSMQRDITRQEALGFILRGILEGVGFAEVAVALVDHEDGTLKGELALGGTFDGIGSLRVPLTDQRNLLVMASTRRAPVVITHFASDALAAVVGGGLAEGEWREGVGADVPGAKAAVVAVPLIARETVVGVICALRTRPPVIRRSEVELLLLYANTAGLTVERARLYTRMHEDLESLEVTDHVTRLHTLQHGQRRAREEVAACRASGQPFAALMLGVDRFAEYNRRHGHDLGDRALAEVAQIVLEVLRGQGVAFRYAGRLLAAAVPGAAGGTAASLAGEIVQRVRDHRFPGAGGQRDQTLTCSAGVGSWRAGPPLPGADEMFRTAMGLLRRAEDEGGDRVIGAEG